jgi:riboflavin kinase/FMN adenylyltransferase
MARAITIGNFDGVHLGHRALIQRAVELAGVASQAAVLTFEPHPREFLGIRPIPERLCSLDEKQRRIRMLGVDDIIVQKFDAAFANQTAEEFLDQLRKDFLPKHIVVGTNFFFGKNRSGNPKILQQWGQKNNVHIEVMEPLLHDGIIVSSTEIRIHVQSGNIKLANTICGFDFMLPMEVKSGDKRGRELGFPTLNSIPPQLPTPAKFCLPPHGVYITRLRCGEKSFAAITNFGIRPTFHNASAGEFFESHVLSQWDDCLSSEHLSVDFIDRIRPEKRFDSKEALIQQIQEDIRIARLAHGL